MDARSPPGRTISQGTVKVRNISALPEILAESGVPLGDVLARAGVERDIFGNPEQVLSYRSAGRLLDECAAATNLEDFGLQLGMRQSAAILGLAGYVGANAPTVREALEIMVGSLRLSDTGGAASLALEDELAILRWVVLETDIPGLDHIGDIAIAIACNILRGLCGSSWSPAEVCLTRSRPKNGGSYAKFFNAPVRFDMEVDCLIFEAEHLGRTVAGRDPLLHQILSPLLEQALSESEVGFRERVGDMLRAQLQTGPLTPDRAAAALGISARTLARRLAEESATFSELAQTIRLEAAQRLLRTGKSLSEISEALGYSDPTAFIRAFKQAAGVTPARWRRSL